LSSSNGTTYVLSTSVLTQLHVDTTDLREDVPT